MKKMRMYQFCKYCDAKIQVVNKTFGLVECTKCSLIFSQKKFSQDELRETYHHLYNDQDPQYKVHSFDEYEKLQKGVIEVGYNKNRLLNKYLEGNSKVLEIGSGVGLIGCYIKKRFPGISYKGVELDEEANKKAKFFGLDVCQGDFTIIENFNERYDVILMWEVLEHIQDLKNCIAVIKEKLVPGGRFIFSVPNYDKRLNYKNPGDNLFTSGPPVHLNFFKKKSIKKIFTSEKFEVVDIGKKRFPYLNLKSFQKMFTRIISGKFEGPTIYSVVKKND